MIAVLFLVVTLCAYFLIRQYLHERAYARAVRERILNLKR